MQNRTGLLRLTFAAISTLVLALAGAAGAAGADDIPKGKYIHIHVKGNPPRITKVLPSNKGVCRSDKTEDCEDEVTWVLKASNLPADWYVDISLKSGATKKCFAKAPFKVTEDQPVSSGAVDAKECDRWDVWPYDVVLRDGKGAEQHRVDPLIIVNR